MEYILSAHIRVTGGSEAAGQIGQVDAALRGLNSNGAGAGQQVAAGLSVATKEAGFLERAFGNVQTAMVRMATYQGIRLIEEGFKAAVGGVLDFDKAMTESLAIQEGVTSSLRGEMEHLAETIAVDLGIAPGEAAKGFYYLASAGLDVNQQLAVLPEVAAFAKAGVMDLDSATELLYDSLGALGKKAQDPQEQLKNLTEVADLLTEAAIASQGTVEQFGEALANRAGAAIRTYNLNLRESIGVLEVFADQGIKGRTAGEKFSIVIRDLAIKALQNADAFKALGIEVFKADGSYNSLVTIVSQFDKALGGMTVAQRVAALGSLGLTQRNIAQMQALFGTSDALRAYVADLGNAGGKAQEVADKQMESLRSKLDQLRSAAIVFSIQGFEKLEQAAAWLVSTFEPAVREVITAIGHLLEGARPLGELFAGLVATAVVEGLKGIATAVETIFSAINAHPGVVEGLGFALASLGGGYILSGILGVASSIGGALVGALASAASAALALGARIVWSLSANGVVDTLLIGLQAGLRALISTLISPLPVAVGIAATLGLVYKAYSDAQSQAHSFAAEVERKYNLSSLLGIQRAIEDIQVKFDEAMAKREKVDESGWFNRQVAGFKTVADIVSGSLYDYGDNAVKAAGQTKAYGEEIDKLNARFKNQIDGLDAVSKALKGPVGLSNAALEGIAKANNIDLAKPYQDWVGPLTEAAQRTIAVKDAMHLVGEEAADTPEKATKFQEAVDTLANSAKNADEKLDALKTIMEHLDGSQTQFDATIAFRESLARLGESLRDVRKDWDLNTQAGRDAAAAAALAGQQARNFDTWTEAGQKAGQSLSGATTKARDMALAIAESGKPEDIQAGIRNLQAYADQIAEVMRSAGVNETVVQKMLETMGLTKPQIETVFKLTQVGKDPKDIKADIDSIGGTKDVEFRMYPTNFDGTKAKLDWVSQRRDAFMVAQPDNVPGAKRELDGAAAPRDAHIQAIPVNDRYTRAVLDYVAEHRDAWINANVYNHEWANQVLEWVANPGGVPRVAFITATLLGINKVTSAIGNAVRGVIGSADGNLFDSVTSYAGGGFENHTAQIARGGAMRLWAEPETGGEAYIPLAASKRDRSLAIWSEVGRRFGLLGTPGGGATSGSRSFSMNAPIHVQVDGTGFDAPALANMIGERVGEAQHAFAMRLATELATR